MRLERVLRMTVNEAIVRGRQEASKRLDRVRIREVVAGDRRRPAAPFPGRFGERAPRCFFEGAADADTTARVVAQLPQCRKQILCTADALCQGRFDLLGYRGLDFGDPVDWHRDPLSGRRAPYVHWSRLNLLDPTVVGDTKVIWELNRHQWLLSLGQAYRFTRDERYAEACAQYVQEWRRGNPTGMGINWASSLEVAFRLISWCWALVMCGGSRAFSADLPAELVDGIEAHARHIERYLSYYFSPNTHLTGEALGLFYAGILFPELPRAPRWRDLGTKILVTQCERHILADGVYFEQSTCYQRYTAEIYLHFLILAARSGVSVPDVVANRLQRLLDFLLAIRRPDGSMPQIGDADSGWLLPLIRRASDDVRGVFAVAAAFFGRPDYAWAAGGPAPEVPWLLGPSKMEVFDALTPTAPRTAPSRLFPHGGYVVMRSGWDPDAHQMVFDVGRLGSSVSGVHEHADLLSVQCAVFGEPYLVDAGTYCYAAHRGWQDYFRSTAAHSTVRVDGHEQAVPSGPFKWQAHPDACLRRWLSTEALELADAEHNGYDRLPGRVRHRRRVVFLKPRYWVIVDDLVGEGEHRVELCYQFAPIEVTLRPDLWVLARGRTGRALLLRPFSTVALTAEISAGRSMPSRGWVSPEYGRLLPAPALIYACTTPLPHRIATLILPTADPQPTFPEVDALIDQRSELAGLTLWGGCERVHFDDDGGVEVIISDPLRQNEGGKPT